LRRAAIAPAARGAAGHAKGNIDLAFERFLD
jgi:hypothetical protein